MARIDGSPVVECSCRTKGPVVVVGTEVVCERCRLPRYMHLDPLAAELFVAGDSGAGKNVGGLPLPERAASWWSSDPADGVVARKDDGAKDSPPPAETVDHPAHYGGADDPYEAIKVIEAWGLNFSLGCVIKYICRREKKGDVIEQLKKARWYLDREIARLEKE